ncbi:hypothetical protein GCM10009122_54240 [Fulvivirga kasyanovii]|uniref:Class I SAM-dependent methyltransferase n=1 Tax=Fulvivirga kasyanovii TaxID=396812 RepID=A0ABW9RXF4_9BACT|nr:class I SAM-dependent methyltransferase [Fulvivirga kasyanovii]MTI28566.1 class I SAM-dependent methyltransferase [Fulvivirga kasyanovii]
MLKTIRNLFKSGHNQTISYKGLNLPNFRTNQQLSSNEDYLNSGIEQVDFLKEKGLLTNSSKILDFGCGQGRLANTLEYTNTPFSSYTGIDTDKKSIDWCNKNLRYKDAYNFIHLSAHNARYNKRAEGLQELPFDKDSFDLIFLNSVFSHMLTNDIQFYLNQFNRVLHKNGAVYLTAFVENDVPDVEENPQNYIAESTGALHRVRYEKNFFISLMENANFRLHGFYHQQIDRTKQSVVILKK